MTLFDDMDYHDFIMFNLNDVAKGEDDVSNKGFNVAITLAIAPGTMDETTLQLYLTQTTLYESTMENAIAFFLGAELLDISCSCEQPDDIFCFLSQLQANDYYGIGVLSKHNVTDEYVEAIRGISDLRDSILSDMLSE